MSTTYWNQWTHAELMSMHGLELEDIDTDLCPDGLEKLTSCCVNGCNCMDCLGLSWRDFM